MNTPLVKRAYNLGLKAVPNFVEALSETQISYYEEHLDELPLAIRRGFIIPRQETAVVEQTTRPVATVVPPKLFKASETDLDWWIDQAEKFARKHLGVEVSLRDNFNIPEMIPWKSVIPRFDPGGLTNRDMVEKALKSQGLTVWEEEDVMKYSGSEASKEPTLHFIQNSERPDEDTLTNPGTSPDQLRETGRLYTPLRGYGLAFGLYFFAKKKHLDPQETFTWFPEDRLPGGRVADGYWNPGRGKVRFSWYGPDARRSDSGGRVAMPVPLKT